MKRKGLFHRFSTWKKERRKKNRDKNLGKIRDWDVEVITSEHVFHVKANHWKHVDRYIVFKSGIAPRGKYTIALQVPERNILAIRMEGYFSSREKA